MTNDSAIHRRRSLRLSGFDYAQANAYFVTICCADSECLFGDIVDGVLRPTAGAAIAREEWFRSAEIRREVVLQEDEFVVMPNHVHGVVRIIDPVGATGSPRATGSNGATRRSPVPTRAAGPPPSSLGAIMVGYKSAVTKRINAACGMPGAPVWQRNYWEHVIRNEADLARIRQYVADNPARWALDQLNAEGKR